MRSSAGAQRMPALHLLLRLFPASFRREYGADMAALYESQWRAARSRGLRSAVLLWFRTVVDLLRAAWHEYTGRDGVLAQPPRRPRRKKERSPMTALAEFREAARQLWRSPLFTVAAIAIIALGIGANTAAFTVVDSFLFRPPPWVNPEEVVNIYQDSDDGDPNSTSFPAYRDMTAYTDVFAAVTATTDTSAKWERGDAAEQAAIEFTTASYLPVFGLQPFRGRWFDADHDVVGAGAYAVVSYRTWQLKLGADESIVGDTVLLNDQPVTVIGIGPKGFNGHLGAVVTDFWLSISSVAVGGEYRIENLEKRQDHWYDVRARLAPGVSVEQAQVAMDSLADHLEQAFPEANTNRRITVFGYGDVRFHPDADAGLMPAAVMIFGVVGLVLLLACSNLANLLLVRGLSRAPEVAVRRALGASRVRIARHFLAEALTLSILGGAVGVLLAYWLLKLVAWMPIDLPMSGDLDLSMDLRVLLFTLVLVLLTGIVFGMVPALRAASDDVSSLIREETRSASAGRGIALFRSAMVAVQVAASIVLIIAAGMLTRSLAAMASAGAGVDSERVAWVHVDLSQADLEPEESNAVLGQVEQRIATHPRVEAVAVTTRLPVTNRGGSTTTIVEGYESSSGTGAVELLFSFVGPDYFEVMGQRLVAGRPFTEMDNVESARSGARVAIINETAARRFWGEEGAIGRRLRSESPPVRWVEVVGVVADSKVRSLSEEPTSMLYRPAGQAFLSSGLFVVRTEDDPTLLAGELERSLAQYRAGVAVEEAGTLEAHVRQGMVGARNATLLMSGFSALALLLASVGIYGVVSFTVTKRTSELGIRLALGASRLRVMLTVLRGVIVTIVCGLVVGVALAAVAAIQLEGVLSGIRSFDPAAFFGGALLLVLVACVASYLPARRAATRDPVETLRSS